MNCIRSRRDIAGLSAAQRHRPVEMLLAGLFGLGLLLTGLRPEELRESSLFAAERIAEKPFAATPPRSREGTQPVMASRRVIQNLKRADELIGQSKFHDAIPYLQSLLDEPDDSYLADPADPSLVGSLKDSVDARLAKLPAEGRASYLLQFGQSAQQMLTDAQASGNADRLCDVVSRYRFTEGGRTAAWQAALRRLDEGRPLESARLLARLRTQIESRALEPGLSFRLAMAWRLGGEEESCEKVLDDLARSQPQLEVVLPDGMRVKLSQVADRQRWWKMLVPQSVKAGITLQPDWLQPGNDSARTRRVLGEGPPAVVWASSAASTIYDPFKLPSEATETPFDRVLAEIVAQWTNERKLTAARWLTGSQPVLVGRTLIVRAFGQLRAYDVETGARRWETLPDITLESLVLRDPPAGSDSPALREFFRQRMSRDALCGALSSDGRRVFAIEDAGLAIPFDHADIRRRAMPPEHNRLCAFDVETGRLEWELGGPSGDYAVDEAGTFFLGAPLVDRSRLHVFGEADGSLRLLTVDAATGQVERSQPLAILDPAAEIARNSTRRLAGLSPSVHQGVVVCATGAGLVVAIDLDARRVRWQLRLPEELIPNVPLQTAQNDPVPDWRERHPLLVAGKVLIPMPGGRAVRALSLETGKAEWTIEGDDLPKSPCWMASSPGGQRLAVVGESSVRMYDLTNGKPIGRRGTSIPTVTGTGIVVGGRLIIPGRQIDVGRATGYLTAISWDGEAPPQSTSLAEGIVPGNLLATSRGLFSQNSHQVLPLAPPR